MKSCCSSGVHLMIASWKLRLTDLVFQWKRQLKCWVPLYKQWTSNIIKISRRGQHGHPSSSSRSLYRLDNSLSPFSRWKMRVRVCECGKQKIENDKNVIYVLLLASIYIKVLVRPALSSRQAASEWAVRRKKLWKMIWVGDVFRSPQFIQQNNVNSFPQANTRTHTRRRRWWSTYVNSSNFSPGDGGGEEKRR